MDSSNRERELSHNYRQFVLFNKEKINRAIAISPVKGEIAFNVIPFLIHNNFKGIPGYVEARELPAKICGFRVDEEIAKSVKTYFPDQPVKDKNFGNPFSTKTPVESLLLMGSTGSVAQTGKSDFDYWVCFDGKAAGAQELQRPLKTKLKLIEEWARGYEMEVHFFPTDIHNVQKDDFGEITKESAGSSMGKILKEEFYRTMILVSGKTPLWWIMPPGVTDSDYHTIQDHLAYSLELEPNNFVDLGNVTKITHDEYFGAALWQMNKALESPYKSVLKMALLEGFIEGDGSGELLCESLKRILFSSPEEKIKYLDPYSIMFDRILDYYTAKNRPDVVDLLCRCFYIKAREKTNPLQSKDGGNKGIDYKTRILENYLDKWAWQEEKLADLNNFSNWDFDTTLHLGAEVHGFLIRTYKNLTDRLQKETDLKTRISETDLTILGRRLFSFYSKKRHKVEPLKNAFDERQVLESISFNVSMDTKRRAFWTLYRGQISKHNLHTSGRLLFKRGHNLVELIVWLVFNGLCDAKTSFYLIPNPLPVSLREIQRLIKELRDFLPLVAISRIPREHLLAESRKTGIFAVVNFTSQLHVNKIEVMALVYTTNWGELYCETYKGMEGVQKLIQYIEKPDLKNMDDISAHYRIFSPRGGQLGSVYKEINNVIYKRLAGRES